MIASDGYQAAFSSSGIIQGNIVVVAARVPKAPRQPGGCRRREAKGSPEVKSRQNPWWDFKPGEMASYATLLWL